MLADDGSQEPLQHLWLYLSNLFVFKHQSNQNEDNNFSYSPQPGIISPPLSISPVQRLE